MGKRKNPRLTVWGEYDSPGGPNSNQTARARWELIVAAKRVYPEFLERLSSDVFPLFEKLSKGSLLAKKGCSFEHVLFSENPRLLPFGVLAPENGFEAALRKWAKKFDAEEVWVFVGALRTLWLWRNPEQRKALNWTHSQCSGGPPGVGERFEFSDPGWETRLFTWAKYREMLRQKFEKTLSEYEKQTRIAVQSQGLVLTRRKYSPKDIEWFVLHQFAGMSSTEIANRWAEGNKVVGESTILKGIKAAAALIEWEHLRKPRRIPNRKIR